MHLRSTSRAPVTDLACTWAALRLRWAAAWLVRETGAAGGRYLLRLTCRAPPVHRRCTFR
jgi:hypothetical protein